MAVIAFIGLGQMGSPMASNLLKQGHQLSVFDVNPDAIHCKPTSLSLICVPKVST